MLLASDSPSTEMEYFLAAQVDHEASDAITVWRKTHV